ncbi:MAG: aldolase [Candidatus Nitronauta litoralis]|uniref:Aldolase n=1 Tax=Candidatus Nitronauta litoralis TaxID=2705533 RepID=A0A7T0G1F7_9BACT|nr:MAG: aldolase [Candidatus Nitronauta litoralis]
MKTRRAQIQVLPSAKDDPVLELLSRLVEDHGASALKLSTEDAAMGFDQVGFWVRRCKGLMPVVVKIGGPNARNDIRELVCRGVDGLIAPMVESPYGLQNFIEALGEMLTPLEFNILGKHINIETITAAKQLDAILDSPWAGQLDEITIGCSDLSSSMGCKVTDPEVIELVTLCTDKIKSKGIPVSIGGGITPVNIDERLKVLAPSHFNTRVVTFANDSAVSFGEAVKLALEFEIEMLSLDHAEGFISAEEKQSRVCELKIRIG